MQLDLIDEKDLLTDLIATGCENMRDLNLRWELRREQISQASKLRNLTLNEAKILRNDWKE